MEIKVPDTNAQWWPRTSPSSWRSASASPRHEAEHAARHESRRKGMKCSVGGRLGGADIARSGH
jgi:hypothetical protein